MPTYYPINETLARQANMMNSYYAYKPGSATAEYRAMVDKAAAIAEEQKSRTEFLRSDDFTYRNGIIARMQSCMLNPDARLRDVLEQWPDSGFDCVVHQEDSDCCVSVSAFAQLTDAGREDFAALLDARVETLRDGGFGLETVISGVEPQELKRLGDAYDAHEQAEQGMWLM